MKMVESGDFVIHWTYPSYPGTLQTPHYLCPLQHEVSSTPRKFVTDYAAGCDINGSAASIWIIHEQTGRFLSEVVLVVINQS